MKDINFLEVNAEQILNQLITDCEQTLGDVLYPGDERRIFLQQLAQVIVAQSNSINDTGRQNLLRYARGELLDALGERTGTPRLLAQKAATTLRFTLSASQQNPITVPEGTRATPDGRLFFATVQALTITPGQATGDVLAEATEAGAEHNGFTLGQINQIVNPVAFVASVSNLSTSTGGADVEPDDDGVNIWSGYRERIRQSPSRFSTAGPEDGYIYWAKTAHPDIQDVAVASPAPGEVKVSVLMKDGQLPSQAVLDLVLAACSAKTVRPLTDQVTTAAPVQVTYNIDLAYYISEEHAAEETSIRAAIEGSGGAADQYKAWQNRKMGRDINPDYLRQLMLNAKAFKIDIVAPVYTQIDNDEVAKTGTVSVSYGGLV